MDQNICLLISSIEILKIERKRLTRKKMSNTNDFMVFIYASLGMTLDKEYQHLEDCHFAIKNPLLVMFTVELLNARGTEGRGDRPMKVVLILAFCESETAERGRIMLMRW